ncbi:MAG: hypothetical protein N2513_02685 [Deltaproteobacteria bacterium]|nr:hypothetical protein [Deltaproteobacteria bacterium]
MMLFRNIFHVLGCFFPFSYLFWGKNIALFIACISFIAISLVEFLRIKGYVKTKFFEKLIKEEEANKPTGSFFFILSCIVVILVFDYKPAVLSLFILSFADSFASFIGRKIGRKKILNKSLEGSLGFYVITFLILYVGGEALSRALLVSLVTTIIELFSEKLRIDDNLTVPLVAATLLEFVNF